MRMGGSRGDGGTDPPEKSQHYRVSKQYWSGSPEKSQGYQASIQCWAIICTTGVSLRADVGPLMVAFGSSLPLSTKKTPLAKPSGSAQDAQTRLSLHREQIYDVRTLSIL